MVGRRCGTPPPCWLGPSATSSRYWSWVLRFVVFWFAWVVAELPNGVCLCWIWSSSPPAGANLTPDRAADAVARHVFASLSHPRNFCFFFFTIWVAAGFFFPWSMLIIVANLFMQGNKSQCVTVILAEAQQQSKIGKLVCSFAYGKLATEV
jgi:hypothetical protein